MTLLKKLTNRVCDGRLEECVLVSQVFPDVCLVENDDTGRILFPCVDRTCCRDTESEGSIAHTQHHDTGMFRCIIRDPSQMRLDHMVSIQERQFAIGLDPNLVLCVLSQVVQCCNVHSELASLGELSKARSQGHEVWSGNRNGKSHRRFGDVVDTIAMQTEDVRVIGSVDEVDEVVAYVVGQLLEEGLGLFFCKRSHVVICYGPVDAAVLKR